MKGTDNDNADAFFVSARGLGVFDGVGGVRELGLEPASMSNDLAAQTQEELQRRLVTGAQKYDIEKQHVLRSSVAHNSPGGWIRNVLAGALPREEQKLDTT